MDLSKNIERKFVEYIQVSGWEILTENGYFPITHSNKTIEYEVYKVTLENGYFLECADDHIIINQKGQQVYAKDSYGQYIITNVGASKVISVEHLGYSESMYDLSIKSSNHTYFSNGILSHNTTVASVILLHYAIFNDSKRIAILANKEASSIEVLDRIKMAFEYLPNWMQRGVVEWNKKSIVFENKSKIIAAATSSSSIRGKSCVTGDSIVDVKIDEVNYKFSINALIHLLKSVEYINLEVLTHKGYKKFKGVLDNGISKNLLKIEFETTEYLKCTFDHRILVGDIFVEACLLDVGDNISGKIIKSITEVENEIVYDLTDVEETHSYYTNGIVSHNCNMVYIDECVGKDTYITIKNKKTNIIENIKIGDLYDRFTIINQSNIIKTDIYKVLTKNGFQSFSGIKQSNSSNNLKITLEDIDLICTENHLIEIEGKFKESKLLVIGDIINGKIITNIEIIHDNIKVYDLLNVEGGNHYLTNNITSHNCAFVDNWGDFYASTYPTISSGTTSKLILTSTPNSRNHFYDIWQGATVGYTNELGEITYNGFVPIKAPYWVIPGRDEAWKMKTLAALQFDEDKFNMEYACISGEVKVKLRNKETGDLLVMSAKELFEEMEKGA